RRGGQIVLLGSGDKALEEVILDAAKKYSKSIAVQIGYDEEQAHRIISGSDVIMVPSRFEPCGLTQLYGLTYGTLPVVHKVGGVADTI
ncbi:glycosyltransferase, partial [Francisella tularensis]|uniref:glycosyltransferase n=1 Tax=Francisella tularensis TaxID=263 RepID=UPI002381B822